MLFSYHEKALEDVQNISEKLHAILASIGKVGQNNGRYKGSGNF